MQETYHKMSRTISRSTRV